jgi:hypothetical protein
LVYKAFILLQQKEENKNTNEGNVHFANSTPELAGGQHLRMVSAAPYSPCSQILQILLLLGVHHEIRRWLA